MRHILLLFAVILILGCITQQQDKKEEKNEIKNNQGNSKYTEYQTNNTRLDTTDRESEPKRTNNTESKKQEDKFKIYPQVWSQHSPAGESWEFKVNCFGNYSTLEECFLWDVDAVQVITPNLSIYALNKDFNINNYSGEVTRRWVLYGPAKEKLPETGSYTFLYLKDEVIVYNQTVEYTQNKIAYPTDVKWQRKDNDLYASWSPPSGVDNTMNYKVIIWNEPDTPEVFVSKVFPWNVDNGLLEDVPFIDGENYSLNVAIFFREGYAYSEYVKVEWE